MDGLKAVPFMEFAFFRSLLGLICRVGWGLSWKPRSV